MLRLIINDNDGVRDQIKKSDCAFPFCLENFPTLVISSVENFLMDYLEGRYWQKKIWNQLGRFEISLSMTSSLGFSLFLLSQLVAEESTQKHTILANNN